MLDINIWFFAFLAAFIYIGYKEYNKPEISIKKALKYLKKYLIRLIVFYQANYSASDQIVLIKKWLDNVDFTKVPKEQLKLLKEYVDKIKSNQ
jgi:hypothetical protein